MYDVNSGIYNETIIEFAGRVDGKFILNGAECEIKVKTTSHSGSDPINVNGIGFTYSPKSHPSPAVSPKDDSNITIYITLYKSNNPSLEKDVSAIVFQKQGRYYLEIDETVKVVSVLPHDLFLLRLTEEGPLTLQKLRDIIANIRIFFDLADLPNKEDYLPVKSNEDDFKELMNTLKKYIHEFVDHRYIFDLKVSSTTDVFSRQLLCLSIRHPDHMGKFKNVVTIELVTGKYEPYITLNTFFENEPVLDKDSYQFLDDDVDPLLIVKSITMSEAGKIIRGIMKIAAQLEDYRFIIDMTP